MNFFNNIIYIHPLTVIIFAIMYYFKLYGFFLLYFLIFLHELAHAAAAILLGEKISSVRLLPTGCLLALSTVPSKKKSFFIFLSGPLFNLLLFLLNIFPCENLSLALFNLILVPPLDGGMLLSLLFPYKAFIISFIFVLLMFIFFIQRGIFPLLPLVLASCLFLGKKKHIEKTIKSKIIEQFNLKN